MSVFLQNKKGEEEKERNGGERVGREEDEKGKKLGRKREKAGGEKEEEKTSHSHLHLLDGRRQDKLKIFMAMAGGSPAIEDWPRGKILMSCSLSF